MHSMWMKGAACALLLACLSCGAGGVAAKPFHSDNPSGAQGRAHAAAGPQSDASGAVHAPKSPSGARGAHGARERAAFSPGVLRRAAKLMRASRLGALNQLPAFSNSNVSATPKLRDNVPDDVWAHAAQHPAPVLPYLRYDGYDRSQQQAAVPVFVLENQWMRVTVYPKWGGKLGSVWAKSQAQPGGGAAAGGFELTFDNPVFQPADLGRRNAWTSGGVEWNWPSFGHSVFTAAPVFVSYVNTTRGTVVRIYEFDREKETTWQVDVMLDGNGPNVFLHPKVVNPGPADEFYWWTNIGVPLHDSDTRVLAPTPLAVMSSTYGLEAVPFPLTDDCGFNVTYLPEQDHSYPGAFGTAREMFLRPTTNVSVDVRAGTPVLSPGKRLWSSYVNGSGYGLVHTQSPVLDGRKFWAWGNDPFDVNRMEFLSTGGAAGNYFELQSGVAPTQFQTFPMAASSSLEWTEALSPVDVAASAPVNAALHSANYSEALGAMGDVLAGVSPEDAWEAAHTFLVGIADNPVDGIVSNGTGWGALHAHRPGALPFSAGVTFPDVSTPETAPWLDLVDSGTFSQGALASYPLSFQVSEVWRLLVEDSAAKHGSTWLHSLHLGVAYMHIWQVDQAKTHFIASNEANGNVQARRALAWIAAHVDGDDAGAWSWYQQAWTRALNTTATPAPSATLQGNLAGEIAVWLLSVSKYTELGPFLASVPETALDVHGVLVARAVAKLQVDGDAKACISFLETTSFPSPGGAPATALVDAWFDSHYELAGCAGDAICEVRQRRAYPPPRSIDFRGAS